MRAGGAREIGAVAIITADRPHFLARCLTSLVRNCDVGRSRPRILIVDGSCQKRHRAAFTRALRSREVIRIATRHVVTRVPNCMAGCMALLNDALLPPFLPAGRNEDGLFGVMLHLVAPDALFAHLSYGIVHASHRRPAYAFGTIPSATEVRLADLLISLIRRVPFKTFPFSATVRFGRLADSLSEISKLPLHEFITCMMKVTLDDRCRRLAELETRMSVDPTYPDYWRTAAEQYRDAFLKSAARPGFYVPIEFRDGGPLDSAFGRLRKFVEEFAELVRWWGRMRELACTKGTSPKVDKPAKNKI